MNLSPRFSSSLSVALLVASAACGGAVNVDPIGAPTPSAPSAPANPETPSAGTTTPAPVAPVGPYTGLVHTTDVSILYPLPSPGEASDFVRPTEQGTHGVLFPKSAFDAVVGTRLDRVNSEPASGYAELALVSVRLDGCSARGNPFTGCTSEVRLVLQALYDKTSPQVDDDPSLGIAATDGAVHVMYDVPEAELVTMMKQLLTLKRANGDLASQTLTPHPILKQQGLGGPFAAGLRSILLEHLGEARIGRITMFDHNFDPDSDGWSFSVFDRLSGNLTRRSVPLLPSQTPVDQVIFGSTALRGPLAQTSAGAFLTSTSPDQVTALVAEGRPAPGAPGAAAALQSAFDAARRLQDPRRHSAESTDCGGCHLAEGAALLGAQAYGLQSAATYTHAKRNLGYQSDRVSITNLHAFGYLHRRVSIMQRTANESAVVADWMEEKVK